VLNVYDLSTSSLVGACNRTLSRIGCGGAFHVGIQVWGREWSYGSTATGCGIGACRPRHCPNHVFRESVDLGVAQCTQRQFISRLRAIRFDWPGSGYKIFERNCCHFAHCLTQLLGVDAIPVWVDRLGSSVERAFAPLDFKANWGANNVMGRMSTAMADMVDWFRLDDPLKQALDTSEVVGWLNMASFNGASCWGNTGDVLASPLRKDDPDSAYFTAIKL